jgi:transcriptional adapter 3
VIPLSDVVHVLLNPYSILSQQKQEKESCQGQIIANMPPASSQKGTGKKGGAGAIRQQPRSRNTTPSSLPPAASLPPIETQETEILELRFDVFRNLTYEDLVDSGASTALIPDSRALDGIVTRLQRLGESIEKRGNYCDRGMRLLASSRRMRMDEMAAEGRREDERRQREAEDEERERKANKKKRKATESLAPQATNIGQSNLPCATIHSYSPLPFFLSVRPLGSFLALPGKT